MKKELKHNKSVESFLNIPVDTKYASYANTCAESIVRNDPSITPKKDPIYRSTNMPITRMVSRPANNRIQRRKPSRKNSVFRHLLIETEFNDKLYSKFNEGSLPHPPVEKERNFIDAQDQFLWRNK